MKLLITSMLTILLMGCQSHCTKPQSTAMDFNTVKQVTLVPEMDESMATLDMADFARRH